MSTSISLPDEEASQKLKPARRKRRLPLSFLIGGMIVLAAVGYLIFANTQSSAVYDMTVSELRQCANCMGQTVRVEGTVQQGSIQKDNTMQQLAFVISDGKQSMSVVYSGVVPDIFTVGIQVVLEGHYGGPGAFQAQTLITKCPSKFTPSTPTT